MVWVALGLGSNHEAEANLASALDELLLRFNDLALSYVFRGKAQDAAAADYLNMAVGIETDMPLQELGKLLKKIEDKHRRERGSGRVTLDIDLLLYGEKCGNFDGIVLPRPEILTAAYVLRPLAQIAAKKKHPALKQSYRDLWEAFDKARQPVAPVAFTWHERIISRAG
ncbi:MAG TPA: 2-amino-4-hydroxy-6-hydroxymethyldihydropteridine diphosphokinase [Pseudomonadales bacterium]